MGTRRLERRHLPDQRLRVHAHRPAAAGDPGGPDQRSAAELVGLGLAVSLTVIVARIVWVFPATYLPLRLSAKVRAARPGAAAGVGLRRALGRHARRGLARRRPVAPARRVPGRDLIIFLTFCVILATLVGQGLTLPWVIRPARARGRDERRARGGRGPPGGDRCGPAAARRARPRSSRTTSELVDQLRDALRARGQPRRRTDAADVADETDQELLDHQAIRAVDRGGPARGRSSGCATTARSATRRSIASSATSTSRRSGPGSDAAVPCYPPLRPNHAQEAVPTR